MSMTAFTSYIRTGGTWVGRSGSWNGKNNEDEGGTWDDNAREYTYADPLPFVYGHYEGGTREPGRFTSELAPASPASRVWKWEGVSVYPAPCYDMPADVTARAREAGHTLMADWISAKGEELGRKFKRALQATGNDWERDVLRNSPGGVCLQCASLSRYRPIPHTCGKVDAVVPVTRTRKRKAVAA